MNMGRKEKFIRLWENYFPGISLPITFYYTHSPVNAELPEPHRCFIAQLDGVRKGRSLYYDVNAIGCPGGKRYTGFSQTLMPGFEHFLSCGIPAKLEGERYKKSPELVKEIMAKAPQFVAPTPFIVFRRWDLLEAGDDPSVVIFFAKPDVLAGLFTLSGFDESDVYAVVAPFSAGCGSIVQYPYLEGTKEHPRAVLGMFDISARPWVDKDTLSFAVPIGKFNRMVDNMEESFLTTASWERVQNRL